MVGIPALANQSLLVDVNVATDKFSNVKNSNIKYQVSCKIERDIPGHDWLNKHCSNFLGKGVKLKILLIYYTFIFIYMSHTAGLSLVKRLTIKS